MHSGERRLAHLDHLRHDVHNGAYHARIEKDPGERRLATLVMDMRGKGCRVLLGAAAITVAGGDRLTDGAREGEAERSLDTRLHLHECREAPAAGPRGRGEGLQSAILVLAVCSRGAGCSGIMKRAHGFGDSGEHDGAMLRREWQLEGLAMVTQARAELRSTRLACRYPYGGA